MNWLNGVNYTQNFHMFILPTSAENGFTWSRVTFLDGHNKNNLIIAVNFLSEENNPNKCKWIVTICHNYHTSFVGRWFLQWTARIILYQDYKQLQRQYQGQVKKEMLFQHTFPGEEALLWIHQKING
jgi:hypothetical protein